MGWWHEGVMGGDTPLDYESDIFHIVGVDMDKYFDGGYKEGEIRQLLLDSLEDLVGRFQSEIGSQVLGYEIMRFGLPVDNELVQEALEAAKAGARCDEWASYDVTRQEEMDAFIRVIEAYDGTPTEVESKGLFEAIGEHLEAGKVGLVNKPGP